MLTNLIFVDVGYTQSHAGGKKAQVNLVLRDLGYVVLLILYCLFICLYTLTYDQYTA